MTVVLYRNISLIKNVVIFIKVLLIFCYVGHLEIILILRRIKTLEVKNTFFLSIGYFLIVTNHLFFVFKLLLSNLTIASENVFCNIRIDVMFINTLLLYKQSVYKQQGLTCPKFK
mgnify:CR=1 FL=1